VRGFAVKFYTDHGNWDLVGNNIPVFFVQDAMKFPDLVHAVKTEPHNGMPQAASAHDTFWDFVSLMPESTHMLMWLMSDRAIPRSYRTMEGFGVNTYRLINDAEEVRFVKFHWKPLQGTHSLVWDEAVKISGADPDFHRRDLWNAIESGEYPAWELGFQVFSEEESKNWSFDILDATKLVPEELVPVQIVGRLVLNRNPDNFFAETEQVAFCPAHLIPGIDFSHDPLLAGRIHSYTDTQISRLGGVNFHELPINASLAQVHNNHRDGMHRHAIHRGAVAYEPNSLAGGCPFQAGRAKGFVSFPTPLVGNTVRGNPEKFAEHYNQATLFYESQTPVEQEHIAGGFRFELSKVSVPAVRLRMLAGLRNVSESLAVKIADGLGMQLPDPLPLACGKPLKPEVLKSSSLSLKARPGVSGIRSLIICILVANGVESAQLLHLFKQLRSNGGDPRFVGQRIGMVPSNDEKTMFEAKHSLENTPGFLFDALVLPGGSDAVAVLAADRLALDAVRDHFDHGKPILALGESASLLIQAGVDAKSVGIITEGENCVTLFLDALIKRRHFRN
jgi:catalase